MQRCANVRRAIGIEPISLGSQPHFSCIAETGRACWGYFPPAAGRRQAGKKEYRLPTSSGVSAGGIGGERPVVLDDAYVWWDDSRSRYKRCISAVICSSRAEETSVYICPC
jgi:hypothetical protein